MNVSLNIILGKIKQLKNVDVSGIDTDMCFKSWEFMTASTSPDPSIIYLCGKHNIRFISEIFGAAEGFHTVFCTGNSEEDLKNMPDNVGIITLTEDEDFFEFANSMATLFRRLTSWEANIDRIIGENLGIQALLDESEDLFDNPVCCITDSFQMPAITKNIPIPHPDIKYAQEHHVLPQHMILEVVKKGYIVESERYENLTYSYKKRYVNCPILVRSFPENRMNIKTMSIYNMNCPPNKCEFDLMKYLTDRTCRYVTGEQNSVVHSESKDRLRNLIVKAIDGTLEDEEVLLFSTLSGKGTDCPFYTYAVCFNNYSSTHVRFLMNTLADAIPALHPVKYKDTLVLIEFMGEDSKDLHTERKNILKNMVKDNDAYCGISISPELKSLKYTYDQALRTAKIGRAEKPEQLIYGYFEYYFSYFCSVVAETTPIRYMYWYDLDKLIESDRIHGANNMELLECYLVNERNINRVGEQMHLHRNSVRYRIGRIEELLETSFDDPEIRFGYLLAFKMLKIKNNS